MDPKEMEEAVLHGTIRADRHRNRRALQLLGVVALFAIPILFVIVRLIVLTED